MAKVYSAPEPAPTFADKSWEQYEKDEQAYVERMQAWARERKPGDSLAGQVAYFGYADGHAVYVVLSAKPLSMMHLAIGDAWDLPDWQTRGLRLADVKAHVRGGDGIRQW